MADGKTKDIKDVEVGDTVVTTDVETGENVEKKVLETIRTEDDKDFTEITVATDNSLSSIVATDTHPFWVPDLREWIPAGDLTTGQWLRTSAGVKVQITALHHYTKRQRTHDLTIDEIHAYYVLAGATPVLVHNCGLHDLARAESAKSTTSNTAGAVARDTYTGEWAYGESGTVPAQIHPQLRGRLDDLMERHGGPWNHGRPANVQSSTPAIICSSSCLRRALMRSSMRPSSEKLD
ncbi:polymorphic toxin-type HINT domain-containing protein [Streptomyces bobili]|uniref:polymorphic toxin-type HINT domain-containing protein n=1 Tax=Streptomyces bobili TaxID=67280 RepID=UPI0034328F95